MKNEKQYPSYYTVIPSYIRYNKNLSYFEIVLYSEITALSNAYGYTFASNSYFARVFDTSTRTISRSISKMANLNLIKIEIDPKNSNLRKIFITLYETNEILYQCMEDGINTQDEDSVDKNVYTPIDKNVHTPIDKCDDTPIDKNVQHNNIKENNNIKVNIMNDNMSINPPGINNTQDKTNVLNPFFKKKNRKQKANNYKPDIKPDWLDDYLLEVEGNN